MLIILNLCLTSLLTQSKPDLTIS